MQHVSLLGLKDFPRSLSHLVQPIVKLVPLVAHLRVGDVVARRRAILSLHFFRLTVQPLAQGPEVEHHLRPGPLRYHVGQVQNRWGVSLRT